MEGLHVLTRLSLGFMRRPRVRALQDGLVTLPDVELDIVDTLGSTERHNRIRAGTLDGGEMSTSGLFRSRLRGEQLVALPVFIKRGFNHQHIVCRADAPFENLSELRARRVGVVHADSSVMVWLRGILKDEYGVSPQDVTWVTTAGKDQPGFGPGQAVEEVQASTDAQDPGWTGLERLDDTPRKLISGEVSVLSELVKGHIDFFCCNTFASGPGIRPVLRNGDQVEADYYQRTQLYPINHTVVLQQRVVQERPDLVRSLVLAFRQARELAPRWMTEQGIQTWDKERAKLGGQEPFAYVFTDEEEHVLRTFMRYQFEQGLLPDQFGVESLFAGGVRAF